jgi:hypothetical protein
MLKPYINTVPAKPGTDNMIKTVTFEKMPIGANSAGMPKGGINSGEMSISHVGGSQGSKS